MSDNNINQSFESMDLLTNLSNDDLRNRLSNEFNFSCGPITASTRSVYLKKLIQLVEDKHQNNLDNNGDRHQNNGSAGDNNNLLKEEPEVTAKPTAVRLSPSRQRSSPRRPVDNELPIPPAKTSTPKNRRQSSMAASTNKKTTSSAKSRKTLAVTPTEPIVEPVVPHPNSHSLNNYSSESSENEDKTDEYLSKVRKSPRKKQPTPRPLPEQMSASQRVPFARPYPPSFKPMTSSPKPSNISSLTRPPLRSPLSSGQPTAKLANYSDSDDTEQEQQNSDSIRDRLLRHRPGLRISSIVTKAAPNPNGTGYEDQNYSSSSNFISFAILVIVVLFFVFIFSFYFYTRISSSPKSAIDLTNFAFINGEELVAPLCPTDDPLSLSPNSDKCLKFKSDIMPALTIANEIKTLIDKSIFKFYCDSNEKITSFSDFKSVDINDIRRAVQQNTVVVKEGREGFKIEEPALIFSRDFANALLLIELNPNWQLIPEKDNMEEFSAVGITDAYPLNLPFSCQTILTLKINSFKILCAFLVVVITIGSILFYKRSKKLATEEQDLVYDLVEKSLELLQSPDNPQSMPVLHIRDTLLSPSERKTSKYKKIWNKVVKHIESTESRVKVDIENIEGDDFKTWKWVAVNSNNSDDPNMAGTTIIRTGSIEWQGQAFNNDHNASQSIPNANNGGVIAPKPLFAAPTVFLKIRNMFDEETKLSNSKEWRNKIRSAVLEKIAIASKNGSHGVVHLEVEDLPEGLVYLKCNSIESATDAFNCLHGWWCQKKLVSVKFLKPERYHQRFPASVHSTTPLTSQ